MANSEVVQVCMYMHTMRHTIKQPSSIILLDNQNQSITNKMEIVYAHQLSGNNWNQKLLMMMHRIRDHTQHFTKGRSSQPVERNRTEGTLQFPRGERNLQKFETKFSE